MSGRIEEWSVVIMKKFDYPVPSDGRRDLIAFSKTATDAVMKASDIIKNEHEGWKMKSDGWLNTNRRKGI